MNFRYFPFMILLLMSCQSQEKTASFSKKVVIAHRGASGYLPEHTMEAKALAYGMRPDYIEQDLVLSKDDVPIVIHDIYLDEVTDVAIQFPDRKRKDGRYYVIDFTYSEILTLRVTERFHHSTGEQVYANRFPMNKGSFRLHSLQDEIELIQGLNKSTGNTIGIYPEIKKPAFHRKNGKDISKIILAILLEYGYTHKKDKCMLQCFDPIELARIRKELKSKLFLVQLTESSDDVKDLHHIATYADGIGPWYKQILSKKVNNQFTFTHLVEDAHALDLIVHPYTFRADSLDEFESFSQMVQVLLFEAKADGAFTDFPDKTVAILRKKENK